MLILFLLNAVLLVTIRTTFACECGIEGATTRIAKGSKTRAHKYPWLAHIRIWPSAERFGGHSECGGSLIDESHVATATHCVVNNEGNVSLPSNIDVYLGRVKAMSDQSKPVSVSSIWIDSRFEERRLQYDFAILTLSKPVAFSQTVGPICLPKNENNLSKLIITGWGVTSDGSSASDDLMEAEVDFVNKKECDEKHKNYLMRINGYPESMRDHLRVSSIPEYIFCAINKETHANVCQGDSGGPIMKKGTNGRYYLMGTISGIWSYCGAEAEDITGLYTRTLYFKDVIKSIAPNACWQD